MAFGGFSEGGHKAPMSEINVTPLVDVMLVLLVIFIITAPLMNSSIKLNLPSVQGASSAAAADVKPIKIAIDAKATVYVDDKAMDSVALEAALKQIAQTAPETEVQLRADEAVAYGKVLAVMGLARQAGLQKIGFVTQAKTPDQVKTNKSE